jgi:hypothetical protein
MHQLSALAQPTTSELRLATERKSQVLRKSILNSQQGELLTWGFAPPTGLEPVTTSSTENHA